ncbi:hypothetical protein F5X68DRAFT_234164 [Plectosphaerella plurivora]|uniref:Uncharacterized protein n=1 Tax=Plectosphaerella plurivora TaxID=936078 RepID=A0A9P8V876_9PEZI|nr:hypothetical protein F5X68DRAFT_234164 [Plectosphaerella plurivora]
MQPSKTYPGKNMPSYPLFKTTYSEGRIPSNDRPESYPKGMWLDIAAVQERVSAMQGNQKGHAADTFGKQEDNGATGAVKFVTSALGNTVGGVSRTVGNVTGAATRGIGDTISGATGSAGRPVGDGLGNIGTGVENAANSAGKGVEDAGQWRRS